MERPPHVGLLLAHSHEALTPQPQSREDEQGPRGPRGLNHHPAGPSQREHDPCPRGGRGLESGSKTGQMESRWGGGQTAPERASGPRAGETLLTEAGNGRGLGTSFLGDGSVPNPEGRGAAATSAQFRVPRDLKTEPTW